MNNNKTTMNKDKLMSKMSSKNDLFSESGSVV